ncbi:MAG TPA: PilZ domain-containing protein [Bryobacteraceae bacterium]|jgi:hypothetical protein|nr:PilZ domain-containing protein [Bryobacteraceae bacterium]
MECRKFPRFEVDAPLQISVVGDFVTHAGRIADVSKRGLRFTSDVSFPVGEVLRFDLADHLLVGAVRYSVRDQNGFTAGIELLNAISKPEFDSLIEELRPEFGAGLFRS